MSILPRILYIGGRFCPFVPLIITIIRVKRAFSEPELFAEAWRKFRNENFCSVCAIAIGYWLYSFAFAFKIKSAHTMFNVQELLLTIVGALVVSAIVNLSSAAQYASMSARINESKQDTERNNKLIIILCALFVIVSTVLSFYHF